MSPQLHTHLQGKPQAREPPSQPARVGLLPLGNTLCLYPLCCQPGPPLSFLIPQPKLKACGSTQVVGTPCSWGCSQDPEHRAPLLVLLCLVSSRQVET